MPAGRPTKYSKKIIDKVIRLFDAWEPYYECPVETQLKKGATKTEMKRCANSPITKRDLCQHLGISPDTLYRWEQQHPEFSDAIKNRYKSCMEDALIKNGLLGQYNPAVTIMLGKNCLKWTDRRELSGTDGGPIKLQFDKEDLDL